MSGRTRKPNGPLPAAPLVFDPFDDDDDLGEFFDKARLAAEARKDDRTK